MSFAILIGIYWHKKIIFLIREDCFGTANCITVQRDLWWFLALIILDLRSSEYPMVDLCCFELSTRESTWAGTQWFWCNPDSSWHMARHHLWIGLSWHVFTCFAFWSDFYWFLWFYWFDISWNIFSPGSFADRLAFRVTRAGDGGGSEAAVELEGSQLNQFLEVKTSVFCVNYNASLFRIATRMIVAHGMVRLLLEHWGMIWHIINGILWNGWY